MSNLILFAKPPTVEHPKSERFSDTFPITVLPSFQGFLPDLTIPVLKGQNAF